jgi:F0F1-type ATP synthase assembly protein I
MEDISILQQNIDKLERDHKAYVEFGAGCFIGIFATGIIIDYTHNYSLWFLILLLSIALIATIVIAVKQDMQKDRYCEELEQLQTIASKEGI